MRFDPAEIDALAEAVAARIGPKLAELLPTAPARPTWLNIGEASAYLDVGRHVIRDAIAAGELIAYRPGKSWRLRPEDLDGWAQRRAREAARRN